MTIKEALKLYLRKQALANPIASAAKSLKTVGKTFATKAPQKVKAPVQPMGMNPVSRSMPS
jgi:hypothetical protein